MKNRIYFATLLFIVIACTKFENADLTERNTFVRFYSSGTNFVGSVAEVDTDGGFILSGEVRNKNGTTDALIIKTDTRGHEIWKKVLPNGLFRAIQPTENGYILLGDGIELNPSSPEVSELVNSYAKLMIMDKQGNISGEHIITDSIQVVINNEAVYLRVDYHGNALAVDPSGKIITLGSFRIPDGNEVSFVSAFDPANLSNSLWYKTYLTIGTDYYNCNALHITNTSALIWASNILTQEQNVSREYLSISSVQQNSAHDHFSLFGQIDDRNHSVGDIQKSAIGLGYGAIGTYSETSGANSNIYFVRVDANGGVIEESARYIDGQELILNKTILETESKRSSASVDEGLAIIGTGDGFVLAGTMASTPSVGNGGKDLLLIKIDFFGNYQWHRLLGGTGDETVQSIRETEDKGLLICGTNTVNGLSSIMLIKTDSGGTLEN
jgi:hypothetical protein